MTFDLQLLPRIELERIEKNGIRYYILPDKSEVPSVTTVLRSLSKKGISKWKKRVGSEKSQEIINKASTRGTIFHGICERYIKGDPAFFDGIMPIHKATFNTLRPHLDVHVTTVYGIESYLYSKKFRTAGTTDLIALWDGIPTIIDFKTALREKKEKYLTGYQMQATCYGLMANELYPDLGIKQIVIIIASDDALSAAVHQYPLDKYRDETTKFFIDHELV